MNIYSSRSFKKKKGKRMDNNNVNQPRRRKRVTKKMAQRRRLTALAIMCILLIIAISLICKSCSGGSDSKGNQKTNTTNSVTSITTTSPSSVIPTVTTTTEPVPTADPDDPNTITKIELDRYSVDLEIGETEMPYVTMTPADSTEKGEIWESSDTSIATVDDIGNITGVAAGTCYVTVKSENNPSVYAEVKVTITDPDGDVSGAAGQTPTTTTGDLQTTSSNGGGTTTVPSSSSASGTKVVNGVTYVDGIMIVNKSYSLPSDYNPGLDSEAQAQFNKLSSDAAKEGLDIWLASGFRSYEYQYEIYNEYVSTYGKEAADTFSARPGYSEHQTGLVIDVNTIDDAFGDTAESDWLAANCYKYGFIVRYPEGKEDITGYKYEPWHIRYLGVETATAVYKSGKTLEEYLGVDSKYTD
jgi:D-alanyl-D-alanine carboxypeptidase